MGVSISIELEFMVAQYENDTTRKMDQDKRWAYDPPPKNRTADMLGVGHSLWADAACTLKICETVATQKLPVGCFHPVEPLPQDPIAKDAPVGSIIQVEGRQRLRIWNSSSRAYPSSKTSRSRFDYWVVVPKGHIAHDIIFRPIRTTPKGYHWIGAALNSPAYTCSTELLQGLPGLRESLDALRENLKIWTNSNCGLHIHAGDTSNQLNIDVVKRVASLVYLLEEPLLLNLCHPSRRTSSHAAMISLESGIAQEPRNYQGTGDELAQLEGEASMHMQELRSLMAVLGNRPKVTPKTIYAIHRIWAEPTISSLRAALRKYNPRGGVTSPCGLSISEFNTIEFRYPEASFDADFITRWAMVVEFIVSIASRDSSVFKGMFLRIYEMVTRSDTPGWPALLAAMGFRANPGRWQERMRQYKYDLHDLDAQPILPKDKIETAGPSSWRG